MYSPSRHPNPRLFRADRSRLQSPRFPPFSRRSTRDVCHYWRLKARFQPVLWPSIMSSDVVLEFNEAVDYAAWSGTVYLESKLGRMTVGMRCLPIADAPAFQYTSLTYITIMTVYTWRPHCRAALILSATSWASKARPENLAYTAPVNGP